MKYPGEILLKCVAIFMILLLVSGLANSFASWTRDCLFFLSSMACFASGIFIFYFKDVFLSNTKKITQVNYILFVTIVIASILSLIDPGSNFFFLNIVGKIIGGVGTLTRWDTRFRIGVSPPRFHTNYFFILNDKKIQEISYRTVFIFKFLYYIFIIIIGFFIFIIVKKFYKK